MNVKECVKGNVTFQFYRKGELFYKCDNGFVFTVPISDTGDACFLNVEKGIFFMRWIRQAVDALKPGEK